MNTEIFSSPNSLDRIDPASFHAHSEIIVEISDTQSHMQVDYLFLRRVVSETLLANEVNGAAISIALVDDTGIQAINRRHLGHDWPTDVITFALSEPADETLAGEVIVSAEMAATTARKAFVSPSDELALYVVHGLLHLCGYDDSTADDRCVMRRREGEVLARLGLPNTFPAVLAEVPSSAGQTNDAGERERARWTV